MNFGWYFVGLSVIGILMIQGTLWYIGIILIVIGIVGAELLLFD